MIPEYKGMTRRGIAWWGNEIRDNTTAPETDEEYIKEFLGIFGIEPYTGDKTGTVIIMPYINSETLLANNRIDYADELEEHYNKAIETAPASEKQRLYDVYSAIAKLVGVEDMVEFAK